MSYRALFVCTVTLALIACSGHSQSPVPIVKSGASLATQNETIHFNATALPSQFVAYAIMPDGRIPGSYGTSAAVYYGGKITILGAYPNATTTVAASINSAGTAVGYAAMQGAFHALLFSHGVIHELAAPPSGSYAPFDLREALSIDDRGGIYGVATELASDSFPILTLYSTSGPGTLVPHTNFDPFPYAKGQLANANSSGDYAFTEIPGLSADPNRRAERGHGLTLTQLFPQYGTSAATWINNDGDITGWVDLTNGWQFFPLTGFIYRHSGITFLPQVAGSNSVEPTGINNRGDVVGYTDSGLFHYTHGTIAVITTDLNIRGQPQPGLSDKDEFIVRSNDDNTYYLLSLAK